MNVGLIIIGNEILAGRFPDANTSFLAEQLLRHGVRVGEVAILPDVTSTVAAKINEYRNRFDLVITTGGIGPTHDDITLDAVSLALGRPMVSHPKLLDIARSKIGDLNEATLKLTRVPEGTELLSGGRFVWPPLKVADVVVLPGVPALIRAQFPALVQLLPDDHYFAREVRCMAREIDLAKAAEEIDLQFDEVDVGSYPIIGQGEHHVLLRFTGTVLEEVEEALAAFLQRLPDQIVVDVVPAND